MRTRPVVIVLAAVNLVLLALLGRSAMTAAEAETVAPVIRTSLIELVDESGAVRAQLQTEESGEVVLRLRDADGNIRVKLGASGLGSGLLLADDRSEVGVHIRSGISSLTNAPDTAITLAGPGGAPRVIRPDGVPE